MAGFDLWNDELCHYGILGQKWGIRRFQNKDGTRTPEGLKRRAKSEEPKRKKVKDMSDDELKQRINRLNLENQYRQLNKSGLQRAVDRVEKFQNERAEWRKQKAALIAAKVSRSKLPLREAIQKIPAKIINQASDHVANIVKGAPDLIIKGTKEFVKANKKSAQTRLAQAEAKRKRQSSHKHRTDNPEYLKLIKDKGKN